MADGGGAVRAAQIARERLSDTGVDSSSDDGDGTVHDPDAVYAKVRLNSPLVTHTRTFIRCIVACIVQFCCTRDASIAATLHAAHNISRWTTPLTAHPTGVWRLRKSHGRAPCRIFSSRSLATSLASGKTAGASRLPIKPPTNRMSTADRLKGPSSRRQNYKKLLYMVLYIALYILGAAAVWIEPTPIAPGAHEQRSAAHLLWLTTAAPLPDSSAVLWLQRDPSTAFLVFDSISGASASGSPGYVPGGIFVAAPSGTLGGTTTYLSRDDVYTWLQDTLVFPAWSDPGARVGRQSGAVFLLSRLHWPGGHVVFP